MPTSTLNIVFGGTPEFAVPALMALIAAGHRIAAVYTQPDRPAGRGQHVTQSPVKTVALAHGLRIEQPTTLRDPSAAARLADYHPDVMVVVAYGLILPAAILAVPRLGCVNIHGSLLPRWRGAAPIHRAVLTGDSLSGVSIMCMEQGLDTGPVLSKRETAIDRRETYKSLHDRLALLGAEALTVTLAQYATGELIPQAQPLAGVTYAQKIRKDEAPLDWRRPAVELDAQVRAFNPWPIAETRWRGQQLRVWDAVPLSMETLSTPGTVLHTDANGIVVATGMGALNLLRVQLAGRKQMSADEFLNAHRIVGDVLEYAPKEALRSESK
jgi:methionyl-tRNA formyltransferase